MVLTQIVNKHFIQSLILSAAGKNELGTFFYKQIDGPTTITFQSYSTNGRSLAFDTEKFIGDLNDTFIDAELNDTISVETIDRDEFVGKPYIEDKNIPIFRIEFQH